MKLRTCTLIIAIALLLPCCKEKKTNTSSEEPVPKTAYTVLDKGRIEANSDKLWSVIPKGTVIEILAEGHDWTEGPLWVASHKMLLYTDIPRNAIYAWKEGENAKIYLKPSGYMGAQFTGSEPGANGLLTNDAGELILCQHGERRVAKMNSAIDDPKPEFTVLASAYNDKRFNSPNDAALSKDGQLYFTDPPYGLPKRMDDPNKELSFQGVYRLDDDGNVQLLTDEFTRPNGIAFSPDGKKLYIANSDPEQAIWKVFELGEDGGLKAGKLFYDATALVPKEKGLPDGLKVADSGTVFATGPGGVLVFTADGELLGTIKTGEATSNCAFNQDQSALYITADSYVLRVRLK